MNKYIYFLILVSALVSKVHVHAQTDYPGISVVVDECDPCLDTVNYNYTGEYTFDTEDIVSDFGPRMICRHDFHGGIDYTVTEPGVDDEGYHIKTLEGGTVYRVRTGGLKYVLIQGDTEHNFSYYHLFTDAALPIAAGDLRMEQLSRWGELDEDVVYRPCIIHYRVQNNQTDTLIYAACPMNDCSQSYWLFNRDTIGYTYDNFK